MQKSKLTIVTNSNIELIKSIKYILEIGLFEPKLTFEKIQEIITKKTVIKNIFNILEELFKRESINFNLDYKQAKNFLVIFMIKNVKEDIFPNITSVEEQLIKKAEEIYSSFKEIANKIECKNLKAEIDVKKFLNKFVDFSKFFDAWKKNDKEHLLIVLSQAYYDLIKTREVLEKQEYENEDEKEKTMIWIDEIKKQKKQIEESIRKIGSEESIDKLLDGSYLNNLYDIEIRKKIIENLKEAYWKNINDEYNSESSEFDLIVKCIKDLKNRLQELVPSRHDLKEEWEKNIKYELLSQEIAVNSKRKILYSIIKYIGKIILDLESKERNNELKKALEDFEKSEKEKNISKILNMYYDHIYYIYEDIQNLKKKLEEKIKTE